MCFPEAHPCDLPGDGIALASQGLK